LRAFSKLSRVELRSAVFVYLRDNFTDHLRCAIVINLTGAGSHVAAAAVSQA
jgi:hypothetical protein